jgi:hypothetical protein
LVESEDTSDCPQIEIRNFIPTLSIRENPGRFNLKKITIKVTSHEVKKGGFFSSDFALYQIETEMPAERERVKV